MVTENIGEKKRFTQEEIDERKCQLNCRKEKYLQQMEDKRATFLSMGEKGEIN